VAVSDCLSTPFSRRLRARGFGGKIIIHTGESRSSLEELRRSPLVDEVIEKGSGRRFKAQFLEIMAGGLHSGERASRTCG